jgi:hypothetical protein
MRKIDTNNASKHNYIYILQQGLYPRAPVEQVEQVEQRQNQTKIAINALIT